MRKISLTRGKYTYVDDQDYIYLNQFNWMCTTKGYAARTVRDAGNWRVSRQELMHRVILETMGIDLTTLKSNHINGDKLDNRRENLRGVTDTQFNYYRRKINARSGFYGVWPHRDKWRAAVKKRHIGTFDDPVKAAKAYNEVALREQGKNAVLNTI